MHELFNCNGALITWMVGEWPTNILSKLENKTLKFIQKFIMFFWSLALTLVSHKFHLVKNKLLAYDNWYFDQSYLHIFVFFSCKNKET
jgi:hypothetical protein